MFLESLLGITLASAATSIANSILSGSTEALVGRAIEATPALKRRASDLLNMVEGQWSTATHETIRELVEKTKKYFIQQYRYSDELTYGREILTDMIALLDRPSFAEEVARRLVFRERVDWGRLRRSYLEDSDLAIEKATERWESLHLPLSDFFQELERQLEVAPGLGQIYRETRQLAELADIRNSSQLIAVNSQLAIAYLETIANHTIANFDVPLSSLDSKLRQILAAVTLEQPKHQGYEIITAGERAYLHHLRQECNDVQLLMDSRTGHGAHPLKPDLRNVYVGLHTDMQPSLNQVFNRLDVPSSQIAIVADLLRAWSQHRANIHIPPIDDELQISEIRNIMSAVLDSLDSNPLAKYTTDKRVLQRAFQPITAGDATEYYRQLVLLGNPGSGKTTFVNHLAYSSATAILYASSELQYLRGEALHSHYFPIVIRLRRIGRSLTGGHRAGVQLVLDALRSLPAMFEYDRLLERLEDSKTIVLFDGLDEIPADADLIDQENFDRREMIVESLTAFCSEYSACKFVVTSRIEPYTRRESQIPGFRAMRLAGFTDVQMEKFINQWYNEAARIGRFSAQGSAEAKEHLATALSEREELKQMARTPLLLAMIANVNARNRLPESRAELYHKCVEQLLWEWEEFRQADSHDGRSLVNLLHGGKVNLQRSDIERVLWELTYFAHSQSGRQPATLVANDLREHLAQIHPDKRERWGWAASVVDLMQERAGLLIEVDVGVFAFPHRTLQEFLAARWLVQMKNRLETAARLAELEIWQEVILLAVGYLTYAGHHEEALTMVSALSTFDQSREVNWRRILVGARAWIEFGVHRAKHTTHFVGRNLFLDIPTMLTELLQSSSAPLGLRIESGVCLEQLGVMPNDLDAYIAISSSQISHTFRIGKYPVTNEQYQLFIDDGGYVATSLTSWWSMDGAQLCKQDQWRWPEWWKGASLSHNCKPVVGVSWYEAEAYCSWLTQKLRKQGDIDVETVARLPTSEEWKLAAAGDEGRRYPWGAGLANRAANTRDFGPRGVTPVNMFREGATPEGVWDMAGNVWEWTLDEYVQFGQEIQGGSYLNETNKTNSNSSDYRLPMTRHRDVGFRVILGPVAMPTRKYRVVPPSILKF